MKNKDVQFTTPEGNTALNQLMRRKYKEKEFNRFKGYAKIFSQFHLKNKSISSVSRRTVQIDGRSLVNFSSANYLGLESHPEVMNATKESIDQWTLHPGCARIFASHTNIESLEEEIRDLVGAPKALINFNTTLAHYGTIPCLYSKPEDIIFIDRFAHTSMREASQMAKAKGVKVVPVNVRNPDFPTLMKRYQTTGNKVLLVDGVYSMSGEIADLRTLHSLCTETNTVLYVDDAHGIGILGKRGGGIMEELGLSYDNIILTGNLQKGLGSFGGFVAGSASMIDYLRVQSKSYIFSGPLHPYIVESARKAIQICRSEEGQSIRKELHEKSRYLRQQIKNMGFDIVVSESPIIPVPVGNDLRTMMAGRFLYDQGFYVNSVAYPAVPRGEGILRISLTALHTKEEMDQLIESIKALKDMWNSSATGVKEYAGYFGELTKSHIKGENYKGFANPN